ncbi:MAG: response regulator transcription factor [Ignavibacteria bacterium]|nr:response regulator transcription factor [Ignavibacteria bacterium]
MKTTRKMRVLLADGHREVRKVLHEYVDKLDGFQVVGEVTDGIRAVKEAERLKPDVVVLDFELQRQNGLEATKLIKQQSASTKVVVTTLFDDPLYRAKARQASADGIIVKSSLKSSLKSVFSTLAHDRGSIGT